MRHLVLFAIVMGFLSACGEPPTPAERLAQKCFEDQMGTRENCDCMAREAETWLGDELLNVFLVLNSTPPGSSSPEAEAARARFAKLSPEETRKVDGFQTAAVDICGLRR